MHCHKQSISHLLLSAYYKTGKVQDLGKSPQRTVKMKIGSRKHKTWSTLLVLEQTLHTVSQKIKITVHDKTSSYVTMPREISTLSSQSISFESLTIKPGKECPKTSRPLTTAFCRQIPEMTPIKQFYVFFHCFLQLHYICYSNFNFIDIFGM